MLADRRIDRQTDRHTDRRVDQNIPHPYRGGVMTVNKNNYYESTGHKRRRASIDECPKYKAKIKIVRFVSLRCHISTGKSKGRNGIRQFLFCKKRADFKTNWPTPCANLKSVRLQGASPGCP